MRIINPVAFIACLFIHVITLSQKTVKSLNPKSDRGPSDFHELIMTKIPGAPVLSKPILIIDNGESVKKNGAPLISQGLGLAAPAYWDWDGDGLKDLLIGEYGSGSEFGRYMGHFIRVYKNIGSESQPLFNGTFEYATPPFEILINGTPYSVDQFCCLGFTPQFIDLNNDGHQDLITGQYYGEVSWFQGSAIGFLPGEALKQEGNPRGKFSLASQDYWLYSSANLGDLTTDGKQDLIVGGIGGLRISKNLGTLSEPRFAKRELLLDFRGNPLRVYELTSKDSADLKRVETKPYPSGDYKTAPLVIDWDNDGILDLLVTNSYTYKGLAAVDFFRGVKVGDEHRFQSRVPLFTTKSGGKAFPGISPFLFVTDWNNDGVNDLLIGVSVVTIHNSFNGTLSWNWEKEMGVKGTGKDPAVMIDFYRDRDIEWILKDVVLPPGITKEDYLTMRHQGYVYIMLGNKAETGPANTK